MSDEDPKLKTYIEALKCEREGYARYGKADKVAEVDAELARVGVTGEKAVPPAPENTAATPPETPEDGQAVETATPKRPRR